MATSSKCPEIGVKKSRQAHNNKVPPDAPRRNLSSFVIFANTRRKELKALYPDRPYPVIQSDISVEWEQMDDDSKEPWRKLMALDKERYKREMELYRKYGSNWVWVVGHLKRKELGLTVEDCTKFEFSSPMEEQGESSKPPQNRIDLEGGRFAKKKRHNDQASDLRPDGHQASSAGSSSLHSMPAQLTASSSHSMESYGENVHFYGIPAASLHENQETLDSSYQNLGDMALLGLVDSFPTAFFDFSLDMSWNEAYGWNDQ
ncbi:High mobility group [Orbilia javanica]|uniref:High mobility group n=1 Tax=Orbilia javanica TaxID=47235 RepID=A0AAN8N808_9PEZI